MVQWMLTSRHGVDCFRHYLDHSHVGSPSLLGVSQQFAGMYSAVFQTWPPSSPEQAEGPVYLLGSVTLQARLPAEKRERIITLLSPLLATSTSACKIAPPPPPRLERLPIAWVTYWVLSNVMTIQFVLSRNSVWTWLGGAGFCKGGIGLVSSWCQNKLSSWFPSFIWCRRYSVLWCYLQRPVVLRFVVSITATPVYCVQGTLSRCCGCVSMVLEEGRVLVWQWNGSSCSVFWHV